MALGVQQSLAHTTVWSSKRPWRVYYTPGVQIALSNTYFDRLGLEFDIQFYRAALVRIHLPGGVGGEDCEVSPYPESVAETCFTGWANADL